MTTTAKPKVDNKSGDAVGDAVAKGKTKKQVQRSPAYPFIPLKKAVERAKVMLEKEGRHAARFSVVVGHWGFSAKSSGAMQTVAALGHYGLIKFGEGLAENRLLQLSERAIKILLDKRGNEERNALQEAALQPKLFSDLWKKWGNQLPSDGNIESYLVVDLKFNQTAIPLVLKSYKETLSYAGLMDSDTVSLADEDKSETPAEENQVMDPGSTDNHLKPEGEKPKNPPGTKPLMAGEEEHLRAKLAGGRTVRVLFQGPSPTQSEIDKLIQHLELIKDSYPARDESDTQ